MAVCDFFSAEQRFSDGLWERFSNSRGNTIAMKSRLWKTNLSFFHKHVLQPADCIGVEERTFSSKSFRTIFNLFEGAKGTFPPIFIEF